MERPIPTTRILPQHAGRHARLLPWLAALLVALALAAAGWNAFAGRRDGAVIAAGRDAVLQAEALLSAMKDLETGQRGFVLTGREDFLDPWRAGRDAALDHLGRLEDTLRRAGAEAPDALRAAALAKLDWTERVITLRREEGFAPARAAVDGTDGKRRMDAVRALVREVQSGVEGRTEALAARDARRSGWLTALSLSLALLACLVLGAYALGRRREERRANALLQGVMENAPIGLGFLDEALRLRLANRALADLGERTLGGMEVGAPLGALLPEEARAEIEPRLRTALSGRRVEGTVDVAIRPPTRPRSVRHLAIGVFPLPVAEGGAGLFALDVSVRRRVEARLRRSEERLRTIVDSIPQLAWMTDETGAIPWYNRRWYEFTGTTPAEMEGWGWKKVHHPDHVDRVESRFREAIERGEAWEDTFPLRGADGRYRWFLSRALPLREEDPDEEGNGEAGRIIGWFGTNTDITELRQAEEELAAARDAAEAANRAKSQFIANMSHELRTPLSAVIGYAEMLEEEAGDAGAGALVEDIRKIHANARHLLSLINDVLDLSKIEAGKMEVQAEDFDAAALLQEVAQTVRTLADRKGNQLLLEVPEDLGAMHSDPVKLRQCLFNLLGNAAKFTEGGRITLSAARRPGEGGAPDAIEFRVADTGIGMTPEQLGRLFQRFTQADASTTRRFGGTGLGLAITKAFCTMLGGDIAVDSAPGRGTTFVIRVPADLRAAPPRGPEAAGAAAAGGLPTGEDPAHPAGLVLVIDDDPATRDLLARFLRREGFAVRCAPDGEEGLRLARELRPAAVLLDVMMPRMDGWAVLSALKADAELARIPVIMVTIVQERSLGFALGAADYLTKPVQWLRLKGVLDRYRPAPSTTPGTALLAEADPAARAELRRLLEAEGWRVTEAAGRAEALAALGADPPGLALVALRLPDEQGGEEGGMDLIREMGRREAWRAIPVIALAEGGPPEPAEMERLRGRVRRVLPADAEPPEELLAELRRIAAMAPRGPARQPEPVATAEAAP